MQERGPTPREQDEQIQSFRSCRNSSRRGVRTSIRPKRSLDHLIQNSTDSGVVYTKGVPEVGTDSLKLSLSETDTGDRGLYTVSQIDEGDKLLRFPLRLALTDHADDPESTEHMYEGAPWSIRLGCKLLREKAKGETSPWFPYIETLPREIPCLLMTFSYDDITAIEYEDMKGKIDYYMWLVVDAWNRLKPEAHGGSTRDAFDWAMSVVHSRVFAVDGKGGPAGIHMLVPLVDMLNHGGDVCRGVLHAASDRKDTLEWKLAPPSTDKEEWEMLLYSVADLAENEQVLVSYGERNNDDFFLFYGFIPPLNPHDDYVLFGSLEEAIDWYCGRYLPEISTEEQKELTRETLSKAESECGVRFDDRAGELSEGAMVEEMKIRLEAGGVVPGSFMAAFGFLGKRNGLSIADIVSARSMELLSTKTHLLDDLLYLKKHIPESEHNFPFLFQFYTEAISKYEANQSAAPLGAKTNALENENASFPIILRMTYEAYKKMILWGAVLGLYRA